MATAVRSPRKPKVSELKITGGPTKSDLFLAFQHSGQILFISPGDGNVYTVDWVKSLSHPRLRRSDWGLEGTVLISGEVRQFRMKYNTRTRTGKVVLN